jgi:hypothetical protein
MSGRFRHDPQDLKSFVASLVVFVVVFSLMEWRYAGIIHRLTEKATSEIKLINAALTVEKEETARQRELIKVYEILNIQQREIMNLQNEAIQELLKQDSNKRLL